ncbi:hypothetical protein CC78DRAFT_453702 [Lojkania enalia]|uniref:PCI domain-containing protein n=1 Tax=Lojkania enalia TaxID=147567 RepID=A0A9P4N9H8_9PLEO|nr:hypothetical protein CC78DRAFT_453702 [Didymosphaeria enalia]
MAFGASLIDTFLGEANFAVQVRDSLKLQSILVLEPPFEPVYLQLIEQLKSSYPSADEKAIDKLQELIASLVPQTKEEEGVDGSILAPGWSQMVTFLASWLAFIRDLDPANQGETYQRLCDLQQKANAAFSHPTKGILILPTLVRYAQVLSRVALVLDKNPEFANPLLAVSASEEGRRESLAEKAANIVRQAFITCLNDRNTVLGGIKNGKPDGKKVGIYKMANICLRILFKSDKLDNCQTIFDNISNSSPPLGIYPASERLTYLYYLGRFHFACTNFYSAQLALQKAYDDCSLREDCKPQRRSILIYLIGANMLLGRFPTNQVYSRSEAVGLRERFEPLARAIRKGDLESFRRITDLNLTHEHARWFCRYHMFYQLGNYCEIYLWRSIFRKVFLLTGKQGEGDRAAATINLSAVLAVFQYFERRALMNPALAQAEGVPGRRHISMIFNDFTPTASKGYVDPDFEGLDLKPYIKIPNILDIESICGSLIMQGFLNGFISHKSKRFAILGARKVGGPLKAGFPNVWQTIKARSSEECHGWRHDGSRASGGTVIRMSGARPAGS